MKKIQTLFGTALLAVATAQNALAVGTTNLWAPGGDAGNTSFGGASIGISAGGNAVDVFQNMLKYAFGFLGLIAVVYAVWGGFDIMKGADDEEAIKKGRKKIIHAIIGVVIIVFSYTIVNFFITGLTSTTISGT